MIKINKEIELINCRCLIKKSREILKTKKIEMPKEYVEEFAELLDMNMFRKVEIVKMLPFFKKMKFYRFLLFCTANLYISHEILYKKYNKKYNNQPNEYVYIPIINKNTFLDIYKTGAYTKPKNNN
jgi:hypothetical protein